MKKSKPLPGRSIEKLAEINGHGEEDSKRRKKTEESKNARLKRIIFREKRNTRRLTPLLMTETATQRQMKTQLSCG
ncbi:MAG: hypothetical protein L6V90_10830 [Treponema succinifaciens]|nr:MAG: hypothetical protein L6V90_10830 [Treponema succinifaciens]